jgi:hypothetical protein
MDKRLAELRRRAKASEQQAAIISDRADADIAVANYSTEAGRVVRRLT